MSAFQCSTHACNERIHATQAPGTIRWIPALPVHGVECIELYLPPAASNTDRAPPSAAPRSHLTVVRHTMLACFCKPRPTPTCLLLDPECGACPIQRSAFQILPKTCSVPAATSSTPPQGATMRTQACLVHPCAMHVVADHCRCWHAAHSGSSGRRVGVGLGLPVGVQATGLHAALPCPQVT